MLDTLLNTNVDEYCRAAAEPKPLVVGIAWVVECAEQAKRADETKFLISLTGVNVAGANKVRILSYTPLESLH